MGTGRSTFIGIKGKINEHLLQLMGAKTFYKEELSKLVAPKVNNFTPKHLENVLQDLIRDGKISSSIDTDGRRLLKKV
jgi:hypothetical protein